MSWMFAKKDLMMMKQMIHKQSVTVHDVMPGSIRVSVTSVLSYSSARSLGFTVRSLDKFFSNAYSALCIISMICQHLSI